MSRRSTTLNNYTGTAITREIDSKYDVIKEVSNSITSIETLVAAINDGSFADAIAISGMIVATGPEGSAVTWDGVTLTIPVGDTGAAGANGTDGADLTINSIDDNLNGTLTFHFSDGTNYITPDLTGPQGVQGIQGVQGVQGIQGVSGNDGLTPQVAITYDDLTGNLEYEITYV